MSHPNPARTSSDAKFQLVGTVAGVDACQLVSDQDEIVVGSAIQCDLVIADPLVPRRAFRLRREWRHADATDGCDSRWILESFPRARTYVNGDLVHRGHVAYGDQIALGCHQLRFRAAGHEPRDRRANTRIDDLCQRLLEDGEVPSGFLESCPNWLNQQRMHKALACTAAMVVVLAVGWLIAPRGQERFAQVELPMQVEIVANNDGDGGPRAGGVRSLAKVERQAVPEAVAPTGTSDILASDAPYVKDMELKPLETSTTTAPAAKPSPPHLEPSGDDVEPNLPTLQVARNDSAPLKIDGPVTSLHGSAPVRRLSYAEATDPDLRGELGDLDLRVANVSAGPAGRATAVALPMNQWSGPVTRRVGKPSPVKFESNQAGQLAALDQYRPTPLRFENRNGNQIPVARMPEKLTELDVKGIAAAQSQPGIQLDGEVSAAEMAGSWKSGQFHQHGPGTPPFAEPATACYVGKTQKDGRAFLYVSFVCTDPNVDQIVSGNSVLNMDDSIEIYLDTTNQRHQYYQMIVTAKGAVWAHIISNSGGGQYAAGPVWAAEPQVKTTINKSAGHWTCEVLIPFDRVGGVPAKGTRWAVNFCRNFRGQTVGHDEQLQCWFLVYDKARNYHNAELFGVFEW